MSNKIRSIDMPNFFYIGDGIIKRISGILIKEGIEFNKCLMVSGANYTKSIADDIAKSLDNSIIRLCINSNDISEIKRIEHAIINNDITLLIAVGGGKIIDAVKFASNNLNKPIISVPTTLSNDGISSPVAVVKLENMESIGTKPPLGIIIDISIVRKAPLYTILAGVGDLISNISAVEDWKLADEYKNERIDRFAEIVSRNAAERFIYYTLKNCNNNFIHDNKFLLYLAEGLIQSGIAMTIVGSSRPASGAEHLISHALDKILQQPKPHGLQVGLATLFTMSLRGADITDLVNVYKNLNLPYKPEMLSISKEQFLQAVKIAPTTRKNRFTILDIVKEEDIAKAYKDAYEQSF